MSMDTLIIGLCLAAAVAFIGRKAYLAVKGRGGCSCGCRCSGSAAAPHAAASACRCCGNAANEQDTRRREG